MVASKRAFEGKTTASTIASILAAEPKPLAAIQPPSPPALDHIIKTCLAKDPDTSGQKSSDIESSTIVLGQAQFCSELHGDCVPRSTGGSRN
jgi:hypothetical protein